MRATEFITEKWSQKYKKSINCSHPKGFSQKAHCAGKKKHNESYHMMEMVCPDCGMCQTHGNLNEIKKGQKDSNGFTRCWPGKHAEGTKKGKNGGWVRKCVSNEGVAEADDKKEWQKQNAKPKQLGKTEKYFSTRHTTKDTGAADKHQGVAEDLELEEQFDIIESMIEYWAEQHNVDSDVIWEDLESVNDEELLSEAEAWQTSKGKNKNGGLNKKGVASYRKSHPGSHLQTAVTTKPSKLKKGSKASKRRKSCLLYTSPSPRD